MMEIHPPLVCNNLKCRKDLIESAVVTTCNHIFCLGCASQNGLAGNDASRRITCPLCDAQLPSAKDVVVSHLNPTEDFKTSVLGGLSPHLIMECARRALNFWVYQTTQNLFYQQHLQRGLSERYVGLSARLDQTVSEANSEIDILHQKIKGLEISRDSLQSKNEELAEAYKDKSRKLLQIQELYDRVKKKAEMSLMQQAASDAIELSIQSVPRPMTMAATATANATATAATTAEPNGYRPSHMQDAPLNHARRFNPAGLTDGVSRLDAHLYGSGNSRENACLQKGLQPLGKPHDGEFIPVNGLRIDARKIGRTSAVSPVMPFERDSGSQPFMRAPHHAMMTDTPGMVSRVESRQRQITHTPSFSQRRDGLSGLGLLSGIQMNDPASFKGFGASVRGHL